MLVSRKSGFWCEIALGMIIVLALLPPTPGGLRYNLSARAQKALGPRKDKRSYQASEVLCERAKTA